MYAQSHVRRIRRSFRGRSVLPKTQRIQAVLLLTRFSTLWRYEIHINLKIDVNALNRRRRRFCVRRKYVVSIRDSEGSMLISGHASSVYAV